MSQGSVLRRCPVQTERLAARDLHLPLRAVPPLARPRRRLCQRECTALTFAEDSRLQWYASSDDAWRGFCGDCGSVLFWDAPARDTISVTAGCLESPTGTVIDAQIFTDDKGDYYALDPRIPIRPKGG
jgi:hypothetical protein